MIYPLTFLARYSSWWLQEDFFGEEDIQFGVLILRLCACALQHLQNDKYPKDDFLDTSREDLEKMCHETANRLDAYRPRPQSLILTQQLYFHINYLKNASKINECHSVLEYTIKEAQKMGLHLESPHQATSEFEMEMRRRTFWNLYVWDRFMSSFLGRWPLIPEAHCTIELPHDKLLYRNEGADTDAPDQFLDRILHIKLTQRMEKLHAEWTKHPPSISTIMNCSREFEEEFVERLPSVFRLVVPDLSWDERLPAVVLKREHLHIAIYGFISNMHRKCKLDDESEQGNQSQIRLIESCTAMLDGTRTLHRLLGGGAQQFFMLAMASLEAAAVLGMALMRMSQRQHRQSRSNLYKRGFTAFLETQELLEVLSPRSLIAKKGILILSQLARKMQTVGSLEVGEQVSSIESRVGVPELEADAITFDPIVPMFEGFDNVEWENMAVSTSMEWFFNDEIFQT